MRRARRLLPSHGGSSGPSSEPEVRTVRYVTTAQLAAVADLIKYWSGHAERFLADVRAKPHTPLFAVKKLMTVYRPYPVVGVITPWNFPFAAPAMDSIPALAAGAAVMLKPSEVTPLSAIEYVRGWTEIGAPPVLAFAIGDGAVGAAVTDHVDFVQFTGSTRTGRAIAIRCAERLIPCSLELGGKDAAVLADSDVDRAPMDWLGAAWSTPARCAPLSSGSTSRQRFTTNSPKS